MIQALELLGKWNPMDVEDALELLSSQFTNRAVRQYAVSRLKEANDDVSTLDEILRLMAGCLMTGQLTDCLSVLSVSVYLTNQTTD